MGHIEIRKRKLDDLRLPLWLFPCGVVRQFQKEQPFIRSERPQLELRRLIAGFNETRILHLFDVFVILRPLHGVESQLRVLILDLERAGVDAHLNGLSGKPFLCIEAPPTKADVP